ncbi:agl cluster protein AglQ [Thermodesulfobacteriota bacterium]
MQTAHSGIALQSNNGTFPPGHNGPYNDKETPVRNTAHWLITMLKAYELSGDNIFKNAAYRAARYLTSSQARPMKATFLCRLNPEKDFCNGLIGQAWVIEALILAGQILEDYRYKKLAKTVFLAHPFNYEIGLWRIVNSDGSYRSYDMTFNHQLWFAAAGGMIDANSDSKIGHRVNRFLNCAYKKHLRVNRLGRIQHAIVNSPVRNLIGMFVNLILYPLKLKAMKAEIIKKEIGYHAFNLYAFAMLKEKFSDHFIWKTNKIFHILEYINCTEFRKGIETNRYAYPYNPPGFEVGYSLQVLKKMDTDIENDIRWWVTQQLAKNFDNEHKLMNLNTEDSNTLAARFYEVTRIENIQI